MFYGFKAKRSPGAVPLSAKQLHIEDHLYCRTLTDRRQARRRLPEELKVQLDRAERRGLWELADFIAATIADGVGEGF